MSFLRGLFRDPSSRRAGTDGIPLLRDVGHRVFVERPPADVWPHLVAPADGAELGVDCVLVLALPRDEPGSPPELATVWRRSNGRLWAGLSTVVAVEDGRRVVSRAAEGDQPIELVTTLEPFDDGCVVAQHLEGVAPDGPVAEFARAWMARALLGLKADAEGTARGAAADPKVEQVGEGHAAYGPEGGIPGLAPVSERVSVGVAVPPEQLWAFLSAPTPEQLSRPGVERLVRVELADQPGRDHVLAVHRGEQGRRAVSVSRLVDATAPSRMVERDLTAPHECDIETTVEPAPEGSVLTETLTAWMPAGPRRVVDPSGLAGLMQTRLEALKHLVEHGASPQRDPRTGFLPPGQDGMPLPVPSGLPARPPVPSSVLLPPPHVVAPAAGYSVHRWPGWADEGFFGPGELDWW